ncbi:MAG: TonB-dependent receptor [Pseudomonadota bacterium]|nr:TonB-dependent receptor [Pseudomonadota bacterium]
MNPWINNMLAVAALATTTVWADSGSAQDGAVPATQPELHATEPAESTPQAQATSKGTSAQEPPTSLDADSSSAETGIGVIQIEELRTDQTSADSLTERPDGSVRLEEIVVTSSYRKENIQDVAGGAHAFGGRALDKAGATGMQDYLVQVPSLSLQKSGNGTARIAMRGISNVNESDLGYGDGSPTTGVYLDDVAIQGSGVFPDLNIYDLSRIEVLKGPQGTLYGEGSMGGAIKMITREPSFNDWEIRGSLMGSQTQQGADSYDGRLAVNIPLWDDRLGARIVGTKRNTGGYVDYTSLNRPDADEEDADSLRGLLRWQLSDSFQADFLHLSDHSNKKQFPVVEPGHTEDLTNAREEDQYAMTDFAINALTLRWTLPFANLTSVSAIYDTEKDTRRRTPVLQTLINGQFLSLGLGQPPDIFSNASTRVITDLDSFSQELRLVSFGGERFDWIVGAFYRDRNQTFDEEKREDNIPDVDPTGGLLSTLLGGFYPLQGRQEQGFGDEAFTQHAAYGELKWNVIPEQFDITGGLRYFSEDIDFFFDAYLYGLEAFLIGSDPDNIDPETQTVSVHVKQRMKSSGLLPKLSASWHFDEDHMAYVAVSRGFRSGTSNILSALDAGPPIIRPDYVLNKEIGTKSTWLDGRLTSNLAVYHIDWKDMQGTVVGTAMLGSVPASNFGHLDNAGDAVAYGAEASVAWLPFQSLTLLANAGFNDGHVIRSEDPATVQEGSKLPNMPRWTLSTTANASFDLPFGLTGDASATLSFIDSQDAVFEPAPQQDALGNDIDFGDFTVPSYSMLKANISAGTGTWRAQLFGENLLDRRAITSVSGPTVQYTVITPRTVGVRLSYEF